jgi:hypothetical protein
MTDRPQRPKADDGEPLADGIGELPPIDGGDPDAAPEADEPLEEPAGAADDGAAWDDPADGFSEEQLRAFSEELGDFEEAGAPDPGDEDELAPLDLDGFDEQEEWPDGADDPSALDDDWFDDGPEVEEAVDDGGADGPVGDDGEDALGALAGAGEQAFDEGEEEDEEAEERELLEAAAEMSADAGDAADAWGGGDLDVQYLGPVRGAVAGAAIVSGAALAAGDGLYRLGADGLLHRYDDEEEELGALTIAAVDEAVFIGTGERGVLRAVGFGRSLVQVEIPSAGEPFSCRVFAQRTSAGVRLVALTGGGRLFASDDLGRSFRGPLLEHRCLAALPVEGEESLLALVARGGEAELLESADLESWSRIALPEPVAALALDAPVSIAAGGGVLAIALDCPSPPLFTSIDKGASFNEIAAVKDVTALAVDGREPGWIAAATYRLEEDVGIVRTSRDAGATWRTAFVTGLAEEREEPCAERGRVVSLSVEGEDTRLLVAVAGDGVYTAELPERGVSH